MRWTYAELDRRARAIAAALAAEGARGERVLLLFPPGLDFIAAFFGCLYAGAVAVPAYPPRPRRDDPRLAAIAADCRPRVVLADASVMARAAALGAAVPALAAARWLAVAEADEIGGGAVPLSEPDAATPAFLQYTSGSTGTPKGVVVTHANLLHNLEMIRHAFGQSESSVVVGWLPLFHDMGLIGNVLQPLYVGGECVLMPPAAFLQKPLRWLAAIDRYGATTSGGPNFAYDLCVHKIAPEQRDGLDLSRWTTAFNGAEPVRAESLARFAAVFGASGFRPAAFYPCYGLAEATLFVSGGEAGSGARTAAFASGSLASNEAVAVPADEGRTLVGCGTAWRRQRLAIVDPESGAELPPGRIGEVWLAGPSVASGYWGQPVASEQAFGARLAGEDTSFLRTGDLGFLGDGGELFLTGRLKDLIILRGRNLYPQDLELTAESASLALRPGCGAAFAFDDGEEERLVVVYEVDRHADAVAALEAVRRAVAEEHEAQVHEVVLVRTGTIPKTSSGKIRRRACADAYRRDGLEVVARSGAEVSGTAVATLLVAPPERSWLRALSPAERGAALLPWLRQEVARLVRSTPQRIAADLPLTALGLDSLAAVELQHETESALAIPLSFHELLAGVTLNELTGRVAERLAGEGVPAPLAAATAPSPAAGEPLSFGQRGLWFLDRLAPEGGAYNLVAVARADGELDLALLRRALALLCERHPSLRSTFDEVDGEPVRRVGDRAEVDFRHFLPDDLTSWDEEAWQGRVAAEAYRPFDLAARPPMRVRIWDHPAGERFVLLVVHHLAADFWSLGLILEELGRIYDAERSGAPAGLPAPAAQYGDFVRRERERLSGPEGERLWAYWRHRLAGELPILDLPTDRPRPPMQSFRGASRALLLPPDLAGRVEGLGRQRGATLFMTLVAAFQALLSRHSAQETILVGSPTANREAPELAGVVGYFTNPVVLRADVFPELSFADLLAAVRDDALGALAHAAYPFPLLTERLQPRRDASRNPLFQAMLVLQKEHRAGARGLAGFALGEAGTAVSLGPFALSSVALGERRSPFDVMLMLARVEGGLAASLQYAAELFDAVTAERFLGHFATLLAGVVADPEQRVGEAPLLRPAEREEVLVAWNATDRDLPRHLLLPDLLAAQALRTPGAPALLYGEEVIAYADLDRRANRLAHHLQKLGVGPEVRVGVCLERHPDLVVALLAVLKAGGAYVPLDPAYPQERLRFMLEDAAAPVVLTRPGLIELAAEDGSPLRVDPADPRLDAEPATDPPRAASPGNLAYLIYTSGSTGRPKAVAIEHRSAVALLGWAEETFSAEDVAGVLAGTSICFDLSVFELFVPLSRGGAVVLAPDALALTALPAAAKVTLINTVPSAMEQLVTGELPAALRVVSLAGEPLPEILARRIHERRPGVRLYNLYGPSEDTTYSTGALIPAGEARPPAIGQPIANTRAYLLDRCGVPVPVGVPGELHLGGEGLARGYLGQPELTAERFVPDPLSGRPGERLYRTGDLARRRVGGDMEFLGRLDHQVKVHGFRIELGEIEAALRRHPLVRECVVVARERPGSGRVLVAYVAGELPGARTAGDLHRYLREHLPAYMVPPFILPLPALPRTPNGKVDRKALPAPDAGRPELGSVYVPPRDGREERLAAVWARVLGVDRVGIHDNFFELGGDSILSLQVVARAREAGLRLTPQQMFQHQTVAAAAAVAIDAPAATVRRQVTGPAPLTPIQLWFLGSGPAEPWHFNQAVEVQARRSLDPRALEAALGELLLHHDALRLRFARDESGSWSQEGAPWSPSGPLAVVDLAALPASRREGAHAAASALLQGGFDLARGPLLRGALFASGDQLPRLLLVAHHLVIDGISWRLLLEDLQVAYSGRLRGEAPELPAKTTSFQDWARSLAAFAAAGGADADLAAWHSLASRPTPGLPADLRPAGGSGLAGAARTVTLTLPAERTRLLLQDLPRSGVGAEVRDALLAALVEALSRRTGRRLLRLDLEGHGREPLASIPPETDLSRTVGWLTALYPAVLDLEGVAEPAAAARAVHAQLAALPGRGLTWGLLRHLRAVEGTEPLAAIPPPELVFNYLGRLDGVFPAASPFAAATLADLPLRGARNRRPHALAVDAWVLDGALTLRWEHAAGAAGDVAVRALAEEHLAALDLLLDAVEATVGTERATMSFHGPEPSWIAGLLERDPDLEDVYPLSPPQAGLLMQALASPNSEAYMQQLSCALGGELDEIAFLGAWQWLVDRHTILRTRFLGRGLEEPLQAVQATAPLPVEREDWSALAADERARRLERYLSEDRVRGFDVGRAPLMRLLLVRTGDAAWHLVLSYHHLLLDGWALVVLMEELFGAYEALRRGGVPAAPAAAPFRDLVDWLRRQDPAPAEEFWRRTVGDFSAPTPLAPDRPVPPPDEPLRHGEVRLRLSSRATAALAAAARRHQLTLGTLVQAAWGLLLSRVSGERDVAFGIVTSGRTADLPDVDRRMGIFINTVPLRLRIEPEALLLPWLREVQTRAADVLRFEHTPLVEVQGWSDTPRGQRMFDSIMAFENYPIDETLRQRVGGLAVSDVYFVERTDYPMALPVTPGEQLLLQTMYDARMFQPATAVRRLSHLRTLLEGLAEREDWPGVRLADLPWLTAAERHQILREWNDTRGAVPSEGKLMHQLFEEVAARSGGAVAVVAGGETLSYGELDRRANRLARRLRALGVGAGSLVAVHLGRSVETVVSVLAILKAGGAYVPVEITLPPARVHWITGFLDLRWVVTQASRRDALREALGDLPALPHLVAADEDDAGGSDRPLAPVATPDDLAYIIFTSGSTGTPKGVVLQHRPVINLIEWVNATFDVGPADRVLFIAALSFDLSVYDIFGLLAAGGSIHVASDRDVREPERLVRILSHEPVTFWDSAPAALQQLVPFLPGERVEGAALRLAFLSGDWIPLGIRDEMTAVFPRLRMIGLGGATEATIWSNFHRIETIDPRWRSIPYGRPIRNARYHVLDERLEPAAVGVAGDLYIGGPCLAWGYAGEPVLTAAKFVPDPFADGPGAVLYRTGDRARQWGEGTLEFLGRLDHQVKIRGFRIELGEIESALCDHPGVRETLVVVREDTPGDRRLVAYVMPAELPWAEPRELREWVAERLPAYMVPAAFVLLEALPATANGKVDRKALPAPESLRGEEKDGVEERPATPLEELVAAHWMQVLRRPSVGLDQDFFELGGQSLLATRLVARLREVLGVDLSLQELFEAPTVAGLAGRLEEMLRGGAAGPDLPIERMPRDGELPLSFGQQRLWFLDRLEPGTATYNIPAAVRLRGDLDAEALAGALRAVVARHEVLRTTFRSVEDHAVQAIAPELALAVPRIDLTALPVGAREAEGHRLAAEEAGRPFDLAAGPLIRMALVRTAESDHLALLTMHHIVADGASVEVLLRELAVLYPALRERRLSPLPDLPVQYADYAAWQARHLEEVAAARLGWWRERLRGAPPLLELPTDRPRPALQRFHGASRSAMLPPALVAGLRGFTLREGVTPFVALLSVFHAVLWRYSGQDDVVVGAPVANRQRVEIEPLIGFFVNTLALRAQVAGSEGLRPLLQRLRALAFGAFAHQDLPFERIVEDLRPERSLGHHPLFQVMFTWETAPEWLLELPGLALSLLPAAGGTTKFDLALSLFETASGLRAAVDFRTDLFDDVTVSRLLGVYERMLAAGIDDPERPLGELDLLSATERHQLVAEGNEGPVEEARLPAPSWFEASVDRDPSALALVAADGALTYGELEARANHLARFLRRLGVGPEVRVGLSVGRTSSLPVALLAIFKAGGAYVPLDPAYPQARLRFIAEDAGVAVLLVEGAAAGLSGLPGVRVLRLDPDSADAAEIAAESAGRLDGGPALHDLAYVIYTSGSTGHPKGVAVEHGSLGALLWACRAEFGWTSGDRMPCIAPYSFDIFLFELLNPLAAGGTVVLLETRPALDLRELLAALADATRLHAVPALMRQVVEAAAERPAESWARLRTLFVGGDRVPPELLADLARVFPRAEVRVLYGPTEGTVICASHRAGTTPAIGERPWIGRPLPGISLRLCDASGTPLPFGVPGEVWIGGPGVARGYWNQEALTAGAFVEVGGRRWYRSGDRARRLVGGALEFLGRIDHQVKVRGFRIDPGEIEAVLREQPEVREAAVIDLPDGTGDRRLVAYAVPAGGLAADDLAALLRAVLAARLPDYMVPAAVLLLPALPLTANGKLDRAALAAPDADRLARRASRIAPRSAVERTLAAIWSEVLGVSDVGLEDGFFDLGGHSLLATQVITRVRTRLGADLPLRAVFEAPLLASFAERVERACGSTAAGPAIEPVPRGERLPASFVQRRLWYLDRLQPGDPSYNMPLPLRLVGVLDPGSLRRALSAAVERHEGLRTRFTEGESGPELEILPAAPVELPQVDLSALPAACVEETARGLAAWEAGLPFDLAQGPLLRLVLLRLASREHLLLATLHHIAADGWSMGTLVREIAQLYRGEVTGELAELPALAVQYADYAVWQRRFLAEGGADLHLAWWRRQLAGAPVPELPADRPRGEAGPRRGGFVGIELPAAVATGLLRLARERDTTLYMALFAAFAALLARYTGRDDLIVGSPLANRQRPEVEGVIGFFVNTLPVRCDLAGDPSWSEILTRVREAVLGVQTHQDVPFELLLQELRPDRRAGDVPFFRTVFTLERSPLETLVLPGLELSPFPVHNGTAKFDLTLTAVESQGRLTAWLEYATDLIDPARARRLLAHFGALLASAAADPARPLSRLELLTAAERHQLLAEWNDTDSAYPAVASVHQLFAEQAAATPDLLAAVCGDEGLTYRELELLANHLAHRLAAHGVCRGARVGILAERSLELLVGLLAILKAGGAYVPLDPAYPADRLELMAEDAGLALVLVQPHLAASVPKGRAAVLLELAGEAAEPPDAGAGPDDLIYVLYTSGSTGRPKGVSVPHRGVIRLVKETDYVRLDRGEILLQMSPLGFDPSSFEIWGSLLNGACLAVMPPGNPTLAEIAREISRHGVTTLWLTTGVFNLFADELPEAFAGLGQLLAGGHALSAPHVRWGLAHLPPQGRLINGYGPTESATFACCLGMTRPEEVADAVSIGRPIANTRVVLLDRALEAVPVGVAGELWIGGDGLARCYLGRPDLTAERFMPHPLPRTAGERLYRTGDLARHLPDGRLEFLGRLDDQVKIRGIRVEPGEVEAVLARHPAVRDAVVVGRPAAHGEVRLVAYLVLAAGGALDEVRSFAARTLPPHLVPADWLALDRLPLNVNGKVDRRALPEPMVPAAPAVTAAAVVSPVAEILAGFWAEVLQAESVGPQDDFYELGGHSLLATQVVARVRAAFGVEVPLRALLKASTLEEFALVVEEEIGRGRAAAAIPPIVPVPRDGSAPLSLAQRRLWFLDRLEPGNPAYNIPAGLRIRGDLAAPALAAALAEILRRHETLRSSFPATGGVPAQRIAPPAPVALPLVDLSALPAALREPLSRELLQAENRRPFDLLSGPLLRVLLLRLGDRDHLTVFTVHHIVSDGWSMEIMIRELAALYPAFAAGRPSPLAELPFQYQDFAAWQQGWLEEEIQRSQLPYWLARLAGASAVLDLPMARSRTSSGLSRHGLVTALLPAELCRELRACGRRQGATLFMVLLTGWKALLHLVSGETDLQVGSPIANRHRREVEELIGFFVNTLVLRTDLTGSPSFLDLLARVREITLEAHAHQDLSFDRLVEELDPVRVPGRNPLFQVMFDMLTFRGAQAELPGVRVEVLRLVEQSSKFDMTLYVAEGSATIELRLAYDAGRFDAGPMAGLLADYQALLAAAMRDPRTPVSALLRPEEMEQSDLLAVFNEEFEDEVQEL